ncbi:MAG: hypothetical protein J0M35_10540 [Candidatus Obscuribacter phosphatis]|uniref:Uncharacterized protein n=1 Tax=Candidatus Obscuribacter phosphatis TaxID=1906157 RepID=A0A8J7TN92_9BACT|nr:hypothetical protein [Candidatus Obscuribacter phosphatis]
MRNTFSSDEFVEIDLTINNNSLAMLRAVYANSSGRSASGVSFALFIDYVACFNSMTLDKFLALKPGQRLRIPFFHWHE